MKFSIITAVYNRERTIGDAMRCLQAQRFEDYEHIVVDGASSDRTLERVRALADARTVLISEPDDGIYDAINKGIARASGDVVGLLHSDDLLADDHVLERVAQAFARDRCLIAYGDLDYIGELDDHVVRRWRAGAFRPERLRRGWMPPHPTVFAAREVFEEQGAYDTSYRIAADYEAMLRYLQAFGDRVTYIPETLVRMRLGGASNKSVRALARKMGEDYRSMRRHRVGGVPVLLWKSLSKLTQFV
mgnify:CR=1 FL=1